MSSVNKVILIGNLGKDPEIRYTESGQAVTNFTLATNEQWKDKSGESCERVEWHNIVVWGKPAETIAQYVKKGHSIYLEGKLQTRKWEDKEGNNRYTTEINVFQFQFLQNKDGGGQRDGGGQKDPDAGNPSNGRGW